MAKKLNDNKRRAIKIAQRDGGWFCHYCHFPIVPVDAEGEPYYEYRIFGADMSDLDIVDKLRVENKELMRWVGGWYVTPQYRTYTLDHKIPRSHGGATTLDNLVLACAQCNCEKHYTHTYEEYVALWEERRKGGAQ